MTKVVSVHNVAADDKDNVVNDFEDDGALFVNFVEEPDGEFTVIAIFGNDKNDTESSSEDSEE